MINVNETFKTADGMINEIWTLYVERGDIVACMTPEGPSDDFVCTIRMFNNFMSGEFVLNHVFRGKIAHAEDDSYYVNAFTVASCFLDKIRAKGVVDLNNWKKLS